MLKINYPKGSVLRDFELKYVQIFSSIFKGDRHLENALNKINQLDGKPLKWDYLLTAPFDELLNLNDELQKYHGKGCKDLSLLTKYRDFSSSISEFFIKQDEVKIESCFYCNIDSIYTFSLLADFKDGLDFMNRASFSQLIMHHGIGSSTAIKIINLRKSVKTFKNINECPVSPKVKIALKKFVPNPINTHSHFQIDHYLPQFKFPYLSLCLYNLIPCCYVCNSKFKNRFSLYKNDPTISNPGSNLYSFDKDASFKLFYHNANAQVLSQDDYAIKLDINSNRECHEIYVDRLNILGRYKIYKNMAYNLIKLKEKYPDSKIQQIATQVGMPFNEIKKGIFGREIFESEYDNSSLIKFKRDIAMDLKII